MYIFKVTWKENGSHKSVGVLAERIEQVVTEMTGFMLDNILSIELVETGVKLINLKELRGL